MSQINDGGPAFPCSNDARKQYNWIKQGMTLRDYFAAKTMQGIFSHTGGYNPEWAENGIDIAEVCYEMADAMLRARKYPSGHNAGD